MKRTCAWGCLAVLALAAPAPRAQENSDLVKAVALVADGKRPEAIEILKKLSADAPSEAVFYQLGNAYALDAKWERAVAAFEDGIARHPLSARLYNGAAMAYEQQLNLARALAHYRKAVALEPSIAYTGGGRFEPEFNAIYIPVIHDHRGANACSGRLYLDDEKMHFVVYHVFSGWGAGNDDSFETPYSNIGNLEVDRKRGAQAYDYSIITLFTNLSGPRRRIAAGEQARVDLKFLFESPIKGYRGDNWTKPDIKFFFVEPDSGERLIKFLEGKKVKVGAR
jgi:tetratricopeptide (TPR) repeat protein